MKIKDVEMTKAEALRVVSRCDDWLNRWSKDGNFKTFSDVGVGFPISGAVKRAIQDFVYATVKMRK